MKRQPTMITREADYSIRAMLYLSQPGRAGDTVPVRELAEAADIPYRFLRRIMAELVGAGFVQSTRGRTGGFRLVVKPCMVSILDVIRTIDPLGTTLNRCVGSGEGCRREGTCPVHAQLLVLQKRLDASLGAITFDGLHRSAGQADSVPVEAPAVAAR